MPETPDLYAQVANVHDKLDDVARSVSALARISPLRDDILDAMARDALLAQVFLLVDGRRTQSDIVAQVKASGTSITQQTVSKKLEILEKDHDLVRPTSRAKNGTRYVHTSLANDLRISRALLKQPAKKAAKKVAKKAAGGPV